MSDFNNFGSRKDKPFDAYSDYQFEQVKKELLNKEENSSQDKNEKIDKKEKPDKKDAKNIKQTIKQQAYELEQRKKEAELEFYRLNPGYTRLTEKERRELEELDTANKDVIIKQKNNSKRNKTFIWLLIILIGISMGAIAIYVSLNYLNDNCRLYIRGEVNAVYIVDGEEQDRFRTPGGLTGNVIYNFNLDIKITSSGSYNVKFLIELYQDDDLLENIIVYNPNRTLFRSGDDGYYYSKIPINGRQTIHLCQGVVIDQMYKNTLNESNFKMVITTYFDKV